MALFATRWLIRLWSGKATLDEARQLPFALLKATVFAMWFGLCAAAYTLFARGNDYHWQVLASMVKVPVLLLVSLTTSFFPLYVVSRLLGLDFRAIQLWRLAGASVAVIGLTLAPLGLVLAAVSATKNYSIVVLSCYTAFLVSGCAGICFFWVVIRQADCTQRRPTSRTLLLVAAWALSFGLIAAQVGWCIRPFVGWTGKHFSWLRHDDMRIYEQVYYEVINLIHGGGARFPESPAPDPSHD